MTHRIASALLLLLAAGLAQAQSTIYRCGNAYTTIPCADGRVVDTSDALASLERRDEAASVASREKRLADDMTRDRLRAEAAVRPAMAGSLGPSKVAAKEAEPRARPKKGAKKKPAAKRNDDRDDFVARVPKAGK